DAAGVDLAIGEGENVGGGDDAADLLVMDVAKIPVDALRDAARGGLPLQRLNGHKGLADDAEPHGRAQRGRQRGKSFDQKVDALVGLDLAEGEDHLLAARTGAAWRPALRQAERAMRDDADAPGRQTT